MQTHVKLLRTWLMKEIPKLGVEIEQEKINHKDPEKRKHNFHSALQFLAPYYNEFMESQGIKLEVEGPACTSIPGQIDMRFVKNSKALCLVELKVNTSSVSLQKSLDRWFGQVVGRGTLLGLPVATLVCNSFVAFDVNALFMDRFTSYGNTNSQVKSQSMCRACLIALFCCAVCKVVLGLGRRHASRCTEERHRSNLKREVYEVAQLLRKPAIYSKYVCTYSSL